jgi:hypothetical protein
LKPSAPTAVRVSAWLFVCSLIPGLVYIVADPRIASLAHAPPATLAIVIAIFAVPLGLLGLVAYLAYHRRNWARWVQCVIVLGTTLFTLPSDPMFLSILNGSASSTALLYGLVSVVQIASAVLLLLPESNRWYRPSSHVRDTPDDRFERSQL